MATTLLDARYDALRTAGYASASVDMLRQYLHVLLGIADEGLLTNTDLWMAFYDTKLIPTGTFGERSYAYLATLGFTDSHLNERWQNFWENAVITPAPPP